MKNLRLFDPLLSVLYEDSDIVAIDKPYGFNAHTNDSKSDFEDQITEGLIEIYEKNLKTSLHVIHRLDQTTTGVMIFGKSPESTKKYADFFLNREAKKTYQFITKSKTQQDQFRVDKKIIHKARELESFTEFQVLKRTQDFELWMAKPMTGRNHQIRIHAASVGMPILGDTLYGGALHPFICLHHSEIRFPNGILLKSEPPLYFENFDLFKDLFLANLLFETDRRRRLFKAINPLKDSFRLVHNKFNEGITIDFVSSELLVQWYKREVSLNETQSLQEYSQIQKLPLANADKPAVTRFRLLHDFVKSKTENKKVLNLFNASNGFSLKATQGKAQQVTTVDANKSRLNDCRDEFLESATQHLFYLRDSLTFLNQCETKKINYDFIICEAPAFFKREKTHFKIEKDLNRLIDSCIHCLTPQGSLLFLTQSSGLHVDTVRRSLSRHKNLEISRVLPSVDFEPPGTRADLIAILAELKN